MEATAVWWAEFCSTMRRPSLFLLVTFSLVAHLQIHSPVATVTWTPLSPPTSYWYRPCLLIQRECAHTGHQKRGSVLMEYGRSRGVPWSVVRWAHTAQPNGRIQMAASIQISKISWRAALFGSPLKSDKPGVVFLEKITL